MRSFTTLAFLALPLIGSVFADAPASPDKVEQPAVSIYSSAHEAFQDLLNALPEESLQAALSGLKDFKDGVFESHHRGVEHVHDSNPALATKLIVAAVRDLQKRQNPSNGTTTAANNPQTSNNPPAQSTAEQSTEDSPPAQSTTNGGGAAPAPNSPAAPSTTAARPVLVPVEATVTTEGRTVVQTTQVLSEVTASVPVTIVRTNDQGSTVTTTENRPAVIKTVTDSAGRAQVTTSAGNLAPTSGEVMTTTNAEGSTFLTTYTPAGGKISSIKLLTTTGEDGKPSTLTSYTFVDPAQVTQPSNADPTTTGNPGLQTAAAVKNKVAAYAVVGGALAMLV